MAWKPNKGDFDSAKVYGQARMRTPQGQLAAEGERTWAFFGALDSRLRVVNASEEEMGVIFASLGIGTKPPNLRVGGKKFHGYGAASVELLHAIQRFPDKTEREGAAAVSWAANLVDRWVGSVPERATTWSTIQHALGELGQ